MHYQQVKWYEWQCYTFLSRDKLKQQEPKLRFFRAEFMFRSPLQPRFDVVEVDVYDTIKEYINTWSRRALVIENSHQISAIEKKYPELIPLVRLPWEPTNVNLARILHRQITKLTQISQLRGVRVSSIDDIGEVWR